ncbi:MAG: hypothetical protein Q8M29_00960 [Bacteroidota bacterium]|nr:hypothetical protein [Bacteroidota bacterium]
MGTVVIPFAIDLKQAQTVFGSKDETLHAEILQSKAFEKYDEKFSFKRELKELIFDYVPENKRTIVPSKLFGLIKGNDGRGLSGEWNDYGYSLLCICDKLGKCLSENEGIWKYNGLTEQLNKSLEENESKLTFERVIQYKKIFDTPFDEEDICTNYFSREEVKYLLDKLTAIKAKSVTADIDFLRLLDRMIRGFTYCNKHNYDWVSFSYEI